jgi:hypothetical protein
MILKISETWLQVSSCVLLEDQNWEWRKKVICREFVIEKEFLTSSQGDEEAEVDQSEDFCDSEWYQHFQNEISVIFLMLIIHYSKIKLKHINIK